jgi:hypothetical protein
MILIHGPLSKVALSITTKIKPQYVAILKLRGQRWGGLGLSLTKWALPNMKSKMNVIMNLNIHRSQSYEGMVLMFES